MIYTVTFNPALDYVIEVPELHMNKTNRSRHEQIFPGGKGINVSIVLKHLGIDSTALGFTAGFTGMALTEALKKEAIHTDFIHLSEGQSRINIKIRNMESMEINGSGPQIPQEAVDQLLKQLEQLTKEDILVLAGSVPQCLGDGIYSDILQKVSEKGSSFVVDATGELLLKTLPFHPFLIKPNQDELGEFFHTDIVSEAGIICYAKQLQKEGARNILVSRGGKGAVLVAENGEVHTAKAPKGTLVNAVGAGDSMVAGFLAGWQQYGSYKKALDMSVACGSASAFSEGLAEPETVKRLLQQLENN